MFLFAKKFGSPLGEVGKVVPILEVGVPKLKGAQCPGVTVPAHSQRLRALSAARSSVQLHPSLQKREQA